MDISTGLLHMLGTMYRWCVAAFSSGLWNISTPVDQVPRSTDARQDRRIVRAAVAVQTASREEIRVHVAPADVTKDHWESFTCSITQIICASGQAIAYTSSRPRWSSGYHTRLWFRGSRVRSRLRSMDFFRA